MPCTTILVGKKASYDGSTMSARNDDSASGCYEPKKFTVVRARKGPDKYVSVLSHVTIKLPAGAMRYTALPNAVSGKGIWAAGGVNELNIAMTATETITSNVRVLGADPLVVYQKAEGEKKEKAGGIGEEDIVVLVLPYIKSARDGVVRLGKLLEEYGTYEMNGIAFQDQDEVWWLESIGGHHWIARRVPDDAYVVMPNQLGIDFFNMKDAMGEQKEYMCSEDLKDFILGNHLGQLSDDEYESFNPREIFGSHDDSDHIYNTPRAWYIERFFNKKGIVWDGENADYRTDSDNIPWCMVPDKKVTVEDVKYLLSSHFQGTAYDPYRKNGDKSMSGAFRSIGVNRNNVLSLFQIRPYISKSHSVIEWLAFGSNAFNAFVPFYANIESTPDYFANTTGEVATDNFYWSNRMIAALTDADFGKNEIHIERYQNAVQSSGWEIINKYDKLLEKADNKKCVSICMKANAEIAAMTKTNTQDVLHKVLHEATNDMKNGYLRSDA